MITETFKATPAKPYESKPAWRGQYLIGDRWHIVVNSSGNPICYASEDSARLAAQWTQAQVLLHTD